MTLTTAPATGPGAPPVATTARRPRIAVRPLLQRNGLLLFLVLLLLIFTAVRPEFLSQANIRNIFLSASVVGILAVGQTIVMLTGGFDLSVAKTAVFAGMVVALAAGAGPVAILLAVVAAALVGLVNGTLISRARVNPFVVTLGMFTILTSVALLVNDGGSVGGLPTWLAGVTSWNIVGVPGIVFWFLTVAVLTHVLLAHTRFGRHVYAVGGNPEASRLAGIKVNRVLTLVYVLCSIAAGISGVLLTARLGTASPVALPAAELDAIAAVIIGGTRLAGGFGSVPRTVLGVIVLSALSSGMILLGISTYWQGLFKGAIIILAVGVDVLVSAKRR